MLLYLYYLVHIIPICFCALSFGYTMLGFEKSITLVCVAGGMACLYFVLLYCLKTHLKVVIAVFSLALFGFFVLLQKGSRRQRFFIDNRWLFIVVLIAAASCVAGILLAKIGVLRKIAIVGIIAYLVVAMILDLELGQFGVAMLLFLIAVILCEEIQQYWKKDGYTDKQQHIIFIMPFLIAWLVVMMMVPVPDKPYDWKIVKVVYNKVIDIKDDIVAFFDKNEDDEYEEAIIGFSTDATLVSSVGGDGEVRDVMTLYSRDNCGSTVYLTGKVFDTFDGKEWTVRDKEDLNDRMMDTLEMYYGVYIYDRYNVSNYIKSSEITIDYTDLDTKFLFAPYKTLTVSDGLSGEDTYQEGGTLYFEKKRDDTPYSLTFYRLNETQDILEEYFDAPHHDDSRKWYTITGKFGLSENNEYAYSKLIEHRNHIREYYCQEIHLSERLEKYMDDVLDGAKTDYEKLKRIEKVLLEFEYSSNPGPLPDYVDSPEKFLDYFIFEKREGFCVYYATAFVLLARAEGIPSRYVQGYYATAEEKKTKMVTSDMAHAWPEAYIEGVGWLRFEPTPGYRTAYGWGISDNTPKQQYTPPSIASYTDASEEMATDGMGDADADTSGKSKNGFRINWYIVITVVGIGVACFTIYLVADNIVQNIRFKKRSETENLIYITRKNALLLKALGAGIRQGETLQEFAERISESLPPELICFIKDYEFVLYSGKTATEEMVLRAVTVNRMLVRRLRSDKKVLFIFFYIRYRFTIYKTKHMF